MHDHSPDEIAVLDALAEAAIVRPEIAAPDGDLRYHVRPSALREALAWIPDEYHLRSSRHSLGERVVAAVIANARAVGRSPYTLTLYALDL